MTPSSAEGRDRLPDRAVQSFVDASRRASASAQRRRIQGLAEVAGLSASFSGVLVDLGEAEVPVVAALVTGRTRRGVVRTVGEDFVWLRVTDGSEAVLARSAIASMRVEPGAPAPAGDRVVTAASNLAVLLADLAIERTPVSVATADGAQTIGTLVAAGSDVIAVRVAPADPAVYVPMSAVVEVLVR